MGNYGDVLGCNAIIKTPHEGMSFEGMVFVSPVQFRDMLNLSQGTCKLLWRVVMA